MGQSEMVAFSFLNNGTFFVVNVLENPTHSTASVRYGTEYRRKKILSQPRGFREDFKKNELRSSCVWIFLEMATKNVYSPSCVNKLVWLVSVIAFEFAFTFFTYVVINVTLDPLNTIAGLIK